MTPQLSKEVEQRILKEAEEWSEEYQTTGQQKLAWIDGRIFEAKKAQILVEALEKIREMDNLSHNGTVTWDRTQFIDATLQRYNQSI